MELWDLRSYVDRFFTKLDHQAGVDEELKTLANRADAASKHAIGLRTNGVRPWAEDVTEVLDPNHVLDRCRQIQEGADGDFHGDQAVFYKVFDLAAKFRGVFSFELKERKFKAYAEQAAEKAKS